MHRDNVYHLWRAFICQALSNVLSMLDFTDFLEAAWVLSDLQQPFHVALLGKPPLSNSAIFLTPSLSADHHSAYFTKDMGQ